MNVDAIMQGLADALEAIPDLHVYPYPQTGAALPVASVGFPDIVYNRAFQRGHHQAVFPIDVQMSNIVNRDAARKGAAFMSQPDDRSIADAIRTDPTLGGVCHTATVLDAEVLTRDDPEVLLVRFSVEVQAAGGD